MSLNGQWHYGLPCVINTGRERGSYISNSVGSPKAYDIRPETLTEFTGLLDKNGKEIYEGDLIKKSGETKIQIYNNKEVHSPYWRICKIVFVEGYFKQIIISQENSYFGGLPSPPADIFKPDVYYEVIGNIYENPELLEVKKGELK